jgi:lysophospholipase L1-like esterase
MFAPHMTKPDFDAPYLELWNGVNKGLEALCKKEGYLYLGGLLDVVAHPDAPHRLREDITIDGVHFDHLGYEMLGRRMAKMLENRLKNGQSILMFGDSITAGYPYYEPVLAPGQGDPKHSFGYWLETLLGVKAINRGISGDTTSGILQRFLHEDVKADMAMFQGGGNDSLEYMMVKDGRDLADMIVQNFQSMGGAAKARGMAVAIIPLFQFDPEWG